MQPSTVERIGIMVAAAGLVGFVVAASIISPLLGLALAAAFLVGTGVLMVIIAVRMPTPPPRREEQA